MYAFKLEAVLQNDGCLHLGHLPFPKGKKLEILLLDTVEETAASGRDPHPLWGKPVEYREPTRPVAKDEWDAGIR